MRRNCKQLQVRWRPWEPPRKVSMASFFPTIWNVLHDGVIVAVDGTVPGTIRLQVSIDYLRKHFSQSGEFVEVVLVDCTRFTYRASDASGNTTELPRIADMAPEI